MKYTSKKFMVILPISLVSLYILLYYISHKAWIEVMNMMSDSERMDAFTFLTTYVTLGSLASLFITYFSYYFFLQKKRIYLALYFVLLCTVFSILPAFHTKPNIYTSIYSIFYMLPYAIAGLFLYLIYDWYNKAYKQKELEKQNIQSELALLKSQINPHFLFNTLNNIDSLIKSNPTKASDTLVELSDMMRYMIYDTNVEKVPLKQELDYIDNYLKLQSLQYANSYLVKYEIKGNTDYITVPPMLFIPFIENAFKHCTDKDSKDAISFSFNISQKSILFEAVNIYNENQKISKDKSSGVGLDIVKRRLEILYPNKHQLTIEQKNDLFCISLKLEFDD